VRLPAAPEVLDGSGRLCSGISGGSLRYVVWIVRAAPLAWSVLDKSGCPRLYVEISAALRLWLRSWTSLVVLGLRGYQTGSKRGYPQF
jgi:hypothetical protein